MFYGFDIYYFILILPALLFGLWAQSQVNNNFAKYSKIGTMRGMTGAQAAEYILQDEAAEKKEAEKKTIIEEKVIPFLKCFTYRSPSFSRLNLRIFDLSSKEIS